MQPPSRQRLSSQATPLLPEQPGPLPSWGPSFWWAGLTAASQSVPPAWTPLCQTMSTFRPDSCFQLLKSEPPVSACDFHLQAFISRPFPFACVCGPARCPRAGFLDKCWLPQRVPVALWLSWVGGRAGGQWSPCPHAWAALVSTQLWSRAVHRLVQSWAEPCLPWATTLKLYAFCLHISSPWE